MRSVPFLDLMAQVEPIRHDIEEALSRVVREDSFVLGDAVHEFEDKFAHYCGVRHCVGVGSGTDALSIILDSLEIGGGDEVITVPNSFIATALAISDVGATPVFCDVDPSTRNIDAVQAESKITDRTRAIIVVHLYGLPVDMDKISELAKRHGIHVIEDACQAHGATFQGERVGSLADAAAFSFYPAKNLGAFGEGGAITTNSETIARKASMIRNVGQDRKYSHVRKGRNSRLDTLQASVLTIKLAHLDKWNLGRLRVAQMYDRLLLNSPIKVPDTLGDRTSANHLYAVELEDRDEVKEELGRRGVNTLVHYPTPIHLQPAYVELGHRNGDFPHAERSASRTLSLPIYPELGDGDIRYIANSLVTAIERARLRPAV